MTLVDGGKEEGQGHQKPQPKDVEVAMFDLQCVASNLCKEELLLAWWIPSFQSVLGRRPLLH